MKNFNIYILQCNDESFYTGIAVDINKRIEQHVRGKGSKYVRNKGFKNVYWISQFSWNRSIASKIEYTIKRLSAYDKQNINKLCAIEYAYCKTNVNKYKI